REVAAKIPPGRHFRQNGKAQDLHRLRHQRLLPASGRDQRKPAADCYSQELEGTDLSGRRSGHRGRPAGVPAGADRQDSRARDRIGEREDAPMIAPKTLKLSLKSLRDFAKRQLPDEKLLELDEADECPLEIVRKMCSPDGLAIQLLFIPVEYGGMGGGAFDVYCVCEEMAHIDLGIATAVLATFLGSDPITV